MNEAVVAQTILAQISITDEKALDRWAADFFIAWPEGVMFNAVNLKGEQFHLEVLLTWEDLYRVSVRRGGPTGKLLDRLEGLYFDNLAESIDRYLGYRA